MTELSSLYFLVVQQDRLSDIQTISAVQTSAPSTAVLYPTSQHGVAAMEAATRQHGRAYSEEPTFIGSTGYVMSSFTCPYSIDSKIKQKQLGYWLFFLNFSTNDKC